MLNVGDRVGGFEIDAKVARGGMAVVYRAREIALGRTVALKVIAPELAEDPTFRHRFTQESRLAASIDHPNIIPIYAAGEVDGLLYLVMRYVDGDTLAAVFTAACAARPRPMPWRSFGQMAGRPRRRPRPPPRASRREAAQHPARPRPGAGAAGTST